MARRKRVRRFSPRIEHLEGRLLLAGNSIIPVSISVGGGDTGNDASSSGSVSADGRYIAFTSEATNLVSGQSDTPNSPDVFLFDTQTQAMTLVSHASGTPSTTADGFSYAAVISADGNFVVYYSTATNLVAGQVDNNNAGGSFLAGNDIFLFNRQTGETQLVSRVAGSTNITGDVASGNSGFAPGNPAISSDGRYVAFVSQATDLTPLTSDFNGTADVFLFDATANTVQLISRSSSSALVTADGASLNPIISADGRFVAYTSSSSDLVDGQVDQNGSWDLFLFDRDAVGIPNRLVSGANGSATQTSSGVTFSDLEMDLSDDGQLLVFKSFATDLISGATDDNNNSDIFLFNRLDVPGSNITLVSHANGLATTAATGGSASSETPTISGDGRFVAYKSTATNIVAGDSNNAYDVFLFDRVGSGNTLVSHAASSTASANGVSSNPLISGDGNFVVFASTSTNVVTGQVDLNGGNDVFLFDRTTGTTALVSGAAASATTTANQPSVVADINLDGLGVVFLSSAANLTGVDTNGQQDVFTSQTVVPKFVLHNTTYTTEENGGTVRIRIDRLGDVSAVAAVDYRVVSGTATTSASDFVFVQDTLVFAAGETSLTFDVSIIDDGLFEGDETFSVELFDPSPGSILGVPNFATITINDNDGLGLISINSDGSGTGNEDSDRIFLSDDGRFVAFNSSASNLVAGFSDGNLLGPTDVFVRDRLTGITKLVSPNAAGTASGNNNSTVLGISGNGRFVLFESHATDLVAGITDANGDDIDFFVYDQLFETVILVSVNRDGNGTGNVGGFGAQISNDGRYVFFGSNANNFVADGIDTNGFGFDLYRRDLIEGETILVSEKLDGTSSGADLTFAISGDGRFALFLSGAAPTIVGGAVIDAARTSGLDGGLFLRDLEAGSTQLVSVNSTGTSTINSLPILGQVSDDGRFVSYSTAATDVVAPGLDPNELQDIFVRDMVAGTTTIVRGGSNLTGSDLSSETLLFDTFNVPLDMTPDGRFLVFQTSYSDMVAGLLDDNGTLDVFVYDLQADNVIPVSVNTSGATTGNNGSGEGNFFHRSMISNDGRFVAFSSISTTLTLDFDNNQGSILKGDVYLRDMHTASTRLLSANSEGSGSGNGNSEGPYISANGQFVGFTSGSTDLVADINDLNGAPGLLSNEDIFVSPGAFEPGTFQFDNINVAVSEDGHTALLTITRTGGSNGSFVLFFSTSSANGTATQNQDYSFVSSSVQFLDGETSVTIGIPILDDGRDEVNETFTVTLSDGSLDLLGNQITATVTIVDQDTAVVGNQVIESDGDIVTVSLKGPGTFSLTLDDPDGNGKGPLLVALAGTNSDSSILSFTVTKKNGDGFANVGEITGNSGLKSLAGANVNLTGNGLALAGTVLTLALHDVLNGADITLGGSASDFIKMTLHEVDDNTTITLGSGVKTLTAAQMGRGTIYGTSIQTLSIKGDKANNIRGDMYSNIFLSGQGISSGSNTLNKVTISHALTDAIFSVFSGAGGIGSITAGRMVRSGISAGYTPTNFSSPLTGGTFGPALNIKSISIKGLTGEGPAFTNSLIGAKTVGTVALASVDLTTSQNAMEDYGVIADTSIGQVTVKNPKFSWDKIGPTDQSISRFHVKVI